MRPDDLGLDSKQMLGVTSDSKNKSSWQTLVDGGGFQRRHPNIVLKKKKYA